MITIRIPFLAKMLVPAVLLAGLAACSTLRPAPSVVGVWETVGGVCADSDGKHGGMFMPSMVLALYPDGRAAVEDPADVQRTNRPAMSVYNYATVAGWPDVVFLNDTADFVMEEDQRETAELRRAIPFGTELALIMPDGRESLILFLRRVSSDHTVIPERARHFIRILPIAEDK